MSDVKSLAPTAIAGDHEGPSAQSAVKSDSLAERQPPDAARLLAFVGEEVIKHLPEVLSKANDAAKTALRFAIVPSIFLELTGIAMIGIALWHVVTSTTEISDIVPSGIVPDTLSTAEFITVIVVGAILVLAAPVALYLTGSKTRGTSTGNATELTDNIVQSVLARVEATSSADREDAG